MSSGNKLRTDNCTFGTERVRKYFVKIISADVIITVTGCRIKIMRCNTVLMESHKNFCFILAFN